MKGAGFKVLLVPFLTLLCLEVTFQIQERKITTAVGKAKRSEGMEGKRSRMLGESEATGGHGEQKVTHVWRKQSDQSTSGEKDHHCRRES